MNNSANSSFPLIEPYIGKSNGLWIDFLLIIGVALLVGLLCVVWVKFMRGRRGASVSRSAFNEGAEAAKRSGKKRRVVFQKRYPTLAETGGLPPLRGEDEATPAPPEHDPNKPEITS